MKTCEFMTADAPEEFKFEGTFDSSDKLLKSLFDLLSHRANQAVHESIFKIQVETMKEQEERLSKGEIWEKHLYYTFIPMVKAYTQRYIVQTYMEFLKKFDGHPQTKVVLTKVALCQIYSHILENEGQFRDLLTKEQIENVKEASIQVMKDLRPEMVGLTFAVPFRDSVYGAIGKSTMKPYEEFMKGVTNTPECFGKPKEWKYLYESKL